MKFNIRKKFSSYMMLISLFLIWVIFSILTKGILYSARNISMLARQTTIVAILSIGMMFVIVAGQIDLSVGSIVGFCGTIAAVLQVWNNWGTMPTIIVTIIVGIICGIWNGYWVAYRKVPAFIVTLGGLLIFRGANFGISKGMSIAPLKTSFSALGQSYMSIKIGWILVVCAIVVVIISMINRRRSKIKYNFDIIPLYIDILNTVLISGGIILIVVTLNNYQGIPFPVLIMLAIATIFTFIANKTVFGRNIYSTGGNLEASALSGINTKKVTMFTFIISSGLAAIAGILLAARLDAATPAAGSSMELDAIAACVIGGTSFSGGAGKIPGVIIGALVMASLDNGMSLINLESYWQLIVKGLILIVAVWVDTMSKRETSV